MMKFFGWLVSFFVTPCTHQWKPSKPWREKANHEPVAYLEAKSHQWWVCEKCGLETNDPQPVGK